MKPVIRLTAVKTRKNPDIDIDFLFDGDSNCTQFFDEEAINTIRKYTYQDILDTVKALKKVRKTGLTNMAFLKNVINVLNGLGYEKEAGIVASIKEGKRFSIKFYRMMLKMMEED